MKRANFVHIVVVCILIASFGWAQSDSQKDKPLGSNEDRVQRLTLSATRIIEVLNERPDVLVELKALAAEKFAKQGVNIQVADITDEELFRRIGSDSTLRSTISTWLAARGYVSKAELQPLSDDLATTDVPRARTAPSEFIRSERLQSDAPDSEPLSADDVPRPTPAQRAIKLSSKIKEPRAQRESDLEPQVLRRESPYNLIALRDLYTQIPEQHAKLRRFGSELFLRDTFQPSTSMDLPAGPDYVLGPGDSIAISIWGGVSQTIARTVDREGKLTLPEAGPVDVVGVTLQSAEKLIQQKLEPQFRNARVSVSLARVKSVRVYVVGDVQRPGAYDVSSLSTPLNALFAAGGPTAVGSLRVVRHMRGDRLIKEIDLYDLTIRGVRGDVARLEAGDTILVPPAGMQVTISGMVKRPAIYEIRDKDRSLDQIVDLAGGLRVGASLQDIRIERIEASERRVNLSLTVPPNADPIAMRQTLGNFMAQDGDIISIAPVLAYSERTIYLDGHVFRPGRQSFRDGMSINDVIRSYQDLLPEPSDHAEIVRLVPPDFHPTTIQFSLRDAMIGNESIELQPFDTIRIFGRYEVDAPKVAVRGEVVRPGEYPMVRGMTAAALIRAAGGFKRSALREKADIASYDLKDDRKVAVRHVPFAVGRALENSDADIPLKPGDIVTIYQIAGWSEIGASITLNGEVQYPGSYGIQDGERLSSVIHRAGGFRTAAYPTGAVLQRVQVRELQERGKLELIRQIEAASASAKPLPTTSLQEQAGQLQLISQQQEQVLQKLRSQPASGRLVINITRDVTSWENTPADVELRPGDDITIPKRPTFVLISGQVSNPSAVTYSPGKNAKWYLHQAGGATELAHKKQIFVVRANGTVLARNSGSDVDVLGYRMEPGDVLVVPQRILGGSTVWQSLLNTAQFLSSVSITARIASSL
ncbi:MAG TPA: SLBB domain-containing protein [Terriglobales bacterium]|nr:SLBB domain-containing protein [Terriglobales bacterium]